VKDFLTALRRQGYGGQAKTNADGADDADGKAMAAKRRKRLKTDKAGKSREGELPRKNTRVHKKGETEIRQGGGRVYNEATKDEI
jgi:hypothetical protein